MITADKLLLKIVSNHSEELEAALPSRDVRVLVSLAKNISSATFITENQGRLLVKIFADNQKKLEFVAEEVASVLTATTWTSPFRSIEVIRKMYITHSLESSVISVEFSFSASLRKLMQSLNKSLQNLVIHPNGKLYNADLTEKNIVTLIDALAEHDFEIEEYLENYYKIIKSWDEQAVKDQFKLTSIVHDNFQKQITADLGINTAIDENIIKDRSMRYQYFTEKTEKIPENLTEKIAARTTSKLWIDKRAVSLDEIFQSLTELKRFPALVVFDTVDQKKVVAEMQKFSESLLDAGIYDQIGIYFRLDNSENGKEFNQLIADRHYNVRLTTDTKIVGVQSGKIPKFLLKTDWKPMSVISIGNTLRHSKTAVYANCCDLIISYTDSEPIVDTRMAWE